MMKKILLLSLCLGISGALFAQQKMWVFFSDKGNEVAEKMAHPEDYLSPQALERRAQNDIPFDENDLPVARDYVEELKIHSLGVVSTSRWLNAAVVELPEDCREEVEALCFVTGLRPVSSLSTARSGDPQDVGDIVTAYPHYVTANTPLAYGESETQNKMLNIMPLHAKGFTGKGVRIALFDSGFAGADTIDAFDSLWANNRILHYWDFVDNDSAVFREDSHGTNVMSTIGANIPGEMVGMAPHASFILCRTEEARRETRQEEHNWVKAMEWVDSLGVDIIHTSLGYSEFDTEAESYTYDEMDGNTTIVSRAADMAARKGILVTTSAGNEGSGSWRHITAPCDGDSVLCVGSVNKDGVWSRFSSIGPSADGQVKPDIVAMGSRTTVASPRNYITRSDGTSFSGPLIGGLVVCLKQAHPNRSNMEIIRAVQLSADQFPFPDERYGYGIPDAAFADSLLSNVEDLSQVSRDDIEEKPQRGRKPVATVKPEKVIVFTDNPQTQVSLEGKTLKISSSSLIRKVEIMRGSQKVVFNPKNVEIGTQEATFDISYLLPGEHYLNIKTAEYEENVKFNR
jgi:serine protease AprX